MAVALPVGCDMDQLRPGPRVQETAQEPLHELPAAIENPFEGDGTSDRPVVEKQGDRAARGQALRLRCRRVHSSAPPVLPAVVRRGPARLRPGGGGPAEGPGW